MGQVLGMVYRVIATHLIKKAGFSCQTANTGAVTLIQRFGSALVGSSTVGFELNPAYLEHFHYDRNRRLEAVHRYLSDGRQLSFVADIGWGTKRRRSFWRVEQTGTPTTGRITRPVRGTAKIRQITSSLRMMPKRPGPVDRPEFHHLPT